MTGGAGDDLYSFGQTGSEDLGSDTITEGTGGSNDSLDTLDFSGTNSGVSVDLSSASAQTVVSGQVVITLNANNSIEVVVGSDLADNISGNSRDNFLSGNPGNDTIDGAGGDDLLRGQTGDDSLTGGSGSDQFLLGPNAQGSDTITEAASVDVDSVIFEDADVAVTFDLSSISGQSWGDGTITLSSATGIEILIGSAQDDTLTGNSLDNVILGLDGDDSITGGDGADVLVGGRGADTVLGGNGSDILIAGYLDFGEDLLDALMDIRDEWKGGNSYQNRVDNILSGSPDPAPIPSGSQLDPGVTVLDDADVDSLVGASGEDWFLDDPDEDSNDKVSGEVETEIDV